MKKNIRKMNYLLLSLTILAFSAAFIGCDMDAEPIDEPMAPPSVVQTYPMNGAVDVEVNGIITATFAEAVDPATITETTFTLSNGTTAVAGTVTYDVPDKKANFSPGDLLAYSTEYTATLTTGVKNSENLAMSENKIWTFTTAAEGIGPDPVNLGTAANYVVLAKAAVSTIPDSTVTGNVGLSPAAETYITGFSMTSGTGYATSAQVDGFIYAATMVEPTPSNLTVAIVDMEAAYTDAGGRATPSGTELYGGAIGGQTFAPGLYKWTTAVTIGSNVTLSGGADDTWIFQIGGDLSIDANFNIVLSGGAQAKNIFWQVAGEAIMGTGSHFEGIVISQTAITMNTGSTINGRLMAQTRIDLDQSTVTGPAL